MAAPAVTTARTLCARLERGSDVDAKGKVRLRTPLYWATKRKDITLFRLLIRFGADVNAVGKCRHASPFVLATRIRSLATVEALLNAGAEIDTKEFNDNTDSVDAAMFDMNLSLAC